MQIQLTQAQAKVWNNPKRFKVMLAGRRVGKSFLAISWLVHQASSTPPRKNGQVLCCYVAPTFRMVKNIAWGLLKEFVEGYATDINESELRVDLPNGARIQLFSADNTDGMRGISVSALVLDEYAFMKKEIWIKTLRPACSDQQAPVMFISSPSGWNHFKELYDNAMLKHDDPNSLWAAFKFTTLEGGNVPVEEIEAAKEDLDEMSFRQEYEASFETLANRVYSAFDRNIHLRTDMNHKEHSQLYLGIDFNVNPMTCAVAYKAGDEFHFFDEIVLPNSNTFELCEEVVRRYPLDKFRLWSYPDPSGKNRKSSAGGGVTDFSIIESYGIEVIAPSKAPAVADRINSVQALLRNVKGRARMYVHPRCKHIITCLDGLTYKEGTNVPDKSLGIEHIGDGVGYLITYEAPIVRKVPKLSFKFAV